MRNRGICAYWPYAERRRRSGFGCPMWLLTVAEKEYLYRWGLDPLRRMELKRGGPPEAKLRDRAYKATGYRRHCFVTAKYSSKGSDIVPIFSSVPIGFDTPFHRLLHIRISARYFHGQGAHTALSQLVAFTGGFWAVILITIQPQHIDFDHTEIYDLLFLYMLICTAV